MAKSCLALCVLQRRGLRAVQVAEKEGRVAQEGEVVNIFAVASGHMYERLQKIMMLSVLRHTGSKVKFWLIKNYMSPEMKRMMPLMAKEYGFEVLSTSSGDKPENAFICDSELGVARWCPPPSYQPYHIRFLYPYTVH